jgi:hypothetical protein
MLGMARDRGRMGGEGLASGDRGVERWEGDTVERWVAAGWMVTLKEEM